MNGEKQKKNENYLFKQLRLILQQKEHFEFQIVRNYLNDKIVGVKIDRDDRVN